MVDPIQYSAVNPVAGFAQGYDLGNAMRTQQAQAIQQQEAIKQAQHQQEIMSQLMQKIQSKTVKPSDYEAATIALPGMREQMKQAFEMHSADTKQAITSEMSQVYSALASNRPDLAKRVLQQRVDAMNNSGAPAEEIQQVQAMLDNIDQNPDFVRLNTGMMLGAIGAKDAFAGTEEQRKAEMQPGALEKQKGEILQQAAQLGLTKAQTNETMVRAKNLGIEGKKAILELEAMKRSGGTPMIAPKDRIDAEQKLRKEYNDQTANFQQVRESFGRVKSSDANAAGDIALIFNYMKMLDPGSVVREGEFATAQNAAGVDTRVVNMYNKLLKGERLSPEQRSQFTGQAEKMYKSAQQREEEVRKGMSGIVKRYGLDENNIFYQGNVEPQAPQSEQAGVTASKGKLPPGWGVTVR